MRVDVKKIAISLVVGVLTLVSVGCNSEAELVDQQKITIRKWLDSKIEGTGLTYSEVGGGIYRVLTAPEDGEGSPLVERGDSLYLLVELYQFSSSFSKTANSLLYTNKAALIPKGVVWSPDTLKVILGNGAILKGVENSLPNCAPGDSLTVFLTSDNAYGDNAIQQMPANTPVVWCVNVDKVIKKAN